MTTSNDGHKGENVQSSFFRHLFSHAFTMVSSNTIKYICSNKLTCLKILNNAVYIVYDLGAGITPTKIDVYLAYYSTDLFVLTSK